MHRRAGLIITTLTLWACGSDGDGPTDPEQGQKPPTVTALYEGNWRIEASEIVQFAGICVGNMTVSVSGVTAECPGSVTFGTQSDAELGGDALIRVSPHVIGSVDDRWGTLTGTVDTTGAVRMWIDLAGGSGNTLDDLTGCTHVLGDSVFTGTVSGPTLQLSARFASLCISRIDSSQVGTQWTIEFTGVASPLDVASATLTIDPASVSLQSGSSTALTVTVEDDSGFVLTDPLVAWSSEDPAIASVTPDGVVSVVEPGMTLVTAAVAGKQAAASVTVSGFVFTSVSVGDFFSCGVTAGGSACWGTGRRGQLGNGTTDEFRLSPTATAGSIPFASVSSGFEHACGLAADGTVYCWGHNRDGQLGDNSTTDRTTPTPVSGGLQLTAVAGGGLHSCGVATDGTAHCWGGNDGGQLGDSSTTSRLVPVAVAGGLTFVVLSAGGRHTCGLTADSTAYCWGYNSEGQLGDNSTTDRTTPTAVWGGLQFNAVAAGGDHSCGLVTNGTAYCWGYNAYGQLGDGSTTGRTTPTAVTGAPPFKAVSTGGIHSCGIATDGTAHCWGYNGEGQLGDGSTTYRLQPTPVAGGMTFVSLSAGYGNTCGLSTLGGVYCWGHGRGTGDGTGQLTTVPVRVAGQP